MLPIQASTQSAAIDHIIVLVHWLMLIMFVGWISYFLYTIFRFRSSKNTKASYHGVKTHFSSYLEIGLVLIEVFLLVGLSIPFWQNVVTAFPPAEKALTVRVVAQQFAWNVHYPGKDGRFGKTNSSFVNSQTNPIGLDPQDPYGKDDILTVNQLNVPINKPVIVRLSSLDVIHCFGIPLMRLKQDVLPGMKIPTWFEATKLGTFEIMCAQLCGVGHYRMRGFVNVMKPEDFKSWMTEQEELLLEEAEADDSEDDFWS